MEKQNYSVLKIYASSTDKAGGILLYEHLVSEAHTFGMAGATVLRGITGYGLSSRIHTARFWELTEKLPVVIEITDTDSKVEEFFNHIKPLLDSMPKGCLVTREHIDLMLQKSGIKKD